ncbi:metal ABC transporter permease [Zavarzinia sp.]|uniref:metal ABC transporter permease n=1 Tax=Zavarzinia sp. TaxID=2027920 RepID=UPI003568CD98
MSALHFLFGPFADYAFMRRALVACFALALGCGPVGVLLMLRRMSLVGDAMSHAVLPGAAVGFLIAGLNIWAMGLGGLIAGLSVALLSGLVTRNTVLREDASFAGFYLISLSLGVLIVSTKGSNVDLLHVLFGTVLAVDDASLLTVAAIASLSLLVLAVIWRPLIVECFDPGFLRAVGGGGPVFHVVFLVLVVVNLVAGFQALGTLMAVGLMMLPAAASRFWAGQVWSMAAVSIVIGILSGWLGLLISYYRDMPSGPAIVITAGVFYVGSILAGPLGGIVWRFVPRRHLEA